MHASQEYRHKESIHVAPSLDDHRFNIKDSIRVIEKNILLVGPHGSTMKYTTLRLLSEKLDFCLNAWKEMHNSCYCQSKSVNRKSNKTIVKLKSKSTTSDVYVQDFNTQMDEKATPRSNHNTNEQNEAQDQYILNLFLFTRSKEVTISTIKYLILHEFTYTNLQGRDSLISFLNHENDHILLDSNYLIKVHWIEGCAIDNFQFISKYHKEQMKKKWNSESELINLRQINCNDSSLQIATKTHFHTALVAIPLKVPRDLKLIQSISTMISVLQIGHLVFVSSFGVANPYSFRTMLQNTFNASLLKEMLAVENELRHCCNSVNASYYILRPNRLNDKLGQVKQLVVTPDYPPRNDWITLPDLDSYSSNWLVRSIRSLSSSSQVQSEVSRHDLAALLLSCISLNNLDPKFFNYTSDQQLRVNLSGSHYPRKTIAICTSNIDLEETLQALSPHFMQMQYLSLLPNDIRNDQAYYLQLYNKHSNGQQLFLVLIGICSFGFIASMYPMLKNLHFKNFKKGS